VRGARNVTVAENNLQKLILPGATAFEWSTQIIPTYQPATDQTPTELEDARLNRQKLSRLRLAWEINEIDVRYFKNHTRPQVDLQTSFTASGLAGKFAERTAVPGFAPLPNNLPENLYGGYGQSLGNLLRTDRCAFSVGLRIEIPFATGLGLCEPHSPERVFRASSAGRALHGADDSG
jgi:hypothetical protein